MRTKQLFLLAMTVAVLIAPAVNAQSTEACSVTLCFTATGDDSTSGTADRYDVRYSFFPIDSVNWDQAEQVEGEPAPHVAGTREYIHVYNLLPGEQYYFRMEVFDEANNGSGLSNLAHSEVPIALPYPNPFNRANDREMVFDCVPEGATVRIYSIDARMVWQQTALDGYCAWNGCDHYGNELPAGMYFWAIPERGISGKVIVQ